MSIQIKPTEKQSVYILLIGSRGQVLQGYFPRNKLAGLMEHFLFCEKMDDPPNTDLTPTPRTATNEA